VLARTFGLFSIVVLTGRARAAAEDLPRYDLPVGRTLSYSLESKAKKDDGTDGARTRTAVRATVVAANADGLRRVIVRSAFTYGEQPEEATVAAFDVFPDGRATRVGRFNADADATLAFPLLPPDAASAAAKWASPPDWTGAVTTYSAAPPRSRDEFVFIAIRDGPINRIYGVTHKTTIRFDKRKGVVVGGEAELSQSYGITQTTTARLTLDKDETLDPARAAELGAAYGKLFEADVKYVDLLSRINEEPENGAKLRDAAKAVLTGALEGVGEAEVVKEFERKIKQHEGYAKDAIDDDKRVAGVLNKPAADWEAKDLNGKTWSRADLKGRVVVMDFWYRGCGWCIYAMPQVKQLAADYKDKPVMVLGMNTDPEEKDARFVVKELGLEYPQIKAEGLPERFGVQGFPTLIIIDQAGVVRGFHSGYRPDLREKLTRRIDELLRKNPA
jgi:thiol-disulfide isomerase/thioredoxin